MSDPLILQKFSARFKILSSISHLRLCHRLAVEGPLSAQQLAPHEQPLLNSLLLEELVQLDADGRYRANPSVLRDLSEFVTPAGREASIQYPRPECCWPHSA